MTNLVDHVFAIRTPCQVLSAVVLFVPVQMPDNVAVGVECGRSLALWALFRGR